MLQHIVQHAAQKADTVVAKLVGPILVHQPDTVVAITPQSWSDTAAAWSTVAVALLALFAIMWEIIRDFRRTREVADERTAQRNAIDARISAVAYALQRQIKSWIRETPEATTVLVETVAEWRDAVKLIRQREGTDVNAPVGEVPGIMDQMIEATLGWYGKHGGKDFDRAEARLVQLVTDAPGASPAVAESARKTFVLFYRATERINREATLYNEYGNADAEQLAIAYEELEQCIELLNPAIGEELKFPVIPAPTKREG